MLKDILVTYLKDLQKIINRGDAREESFYHCLKDMIDAYAKLHQISKCEVGILPKASTHTSSWSEAPSSWSEAIGSSPLPRRKPVIASHVALFSPRTPKNTPR